ncbi:MAG: hypothetical protein R3E44_07445 [Paracoccaceae bacterium]
MMISRLRVLGKDFAEDSRGSMPVEGVIASIFILWWYVASFQIFDAYRQKNANLKAAYAVADIISRQPQGQAIDADFVEGLGTIFDYLTESNRPTWLRVSSVVWDAAQNRNEVAWSYGTGTAVGHTTATLQGNAGRIPVMPEGDSVIIVETNMAYEPIFNIGINAQWYTTYIPTRPRFASCVPFDLHNGEEPACIYDEDIDVSDNSHGDGTPFDPDS